MRLPGWEWSLVLILEVCDNTPQSERRRESQMDTVEEIVDVNTSDGPMATVIHRPTDGKHPAVIVIEEIFGLDHHIQDVTRRFAEQGYVAAAPDLFHRAGRLETVAYDNMPASTRLREGLTDDLIVSDLNTLIAHLGADASVEGSEVGIVGFCYGGRVSFLAACRVKGIGATVVYYGGGIVPRQAPPGGPPPPAPAGPAPIELTGQITSPVLGFFGGQDRGIPPEAVDRIRDTLKELGKESEIVFYPDAAHGFFCDERESYHKESAEDSWPKTLAFFEKHLKATVTSG